MKMWICRDNEGLVAYCVMTIMKLKEKNNVEFRRNID